jgi:hypothetical protein
MTRFTQITLPIITAIVVAAAAAPTYAGPIDPPAGPIAPTTGPEPRIPITAATTPGDGLGSASPSLFKITQPGSYYLTANITGESGKHGIEITASNVTIDLNGFNLQGGAGTLDAITATVEVGSTIGGIAISNGSIQGWGGDGVDLSTAAASRCRVERVTSSGNTVIGISVGPGTSVVNCTAAQNSSGGFIAGSGSTLSACTAYQNSGNGIEIVATPGVDAGSTVINCNSRRSRLDGIRAAGPCVISANSCSANGINSTGAGIRVSGSGSRIDANNCVDADLGIVVSGTANIITRNTCSLNTTRNWDVVVGNVILVVNATTTAAFTGSAGGTAPGSTDPSANFTY